MSYIFNLGIIDIIIVLIFISSFVIGIKKGITRSIVGLLFSLLSVFFSGFFASYLSKFLFDSFIKEKILINISSSLQDTVGKDIILRSNDILSTFPAPILKLFSYYGINNDTINMSIYGTTDQSALVIMNMISPAIIDLIKVILFLLLSMILALVLKPLKRSLIRFARFPVINIIDSTLGGAFGLLKSGLIILIICTIINVAVLFSDVVANVFNEQNIRSTYIFKYIYYNNPINNILSEF